ncbi:MAG: PQQ-binding-like beta-propeller repeat protein [Mariniblastus sp.]|nr:PQQ-binding-like beta-propeller repeat protein [Mariniblastus sp.]
MKAIQTLSLATLMVALLATFSFAQTTGWPMWGGTPSRNMSSNEKGVSLDFDLKAGKNVLWQNGLGSQTYGNPVLADGKVYVGTNNGGGYRKDKYPSEQDKGVVLCFDQKDGKFLWQLTRDKLAAGRVQDWLLQGICSVPAIEGDRMWVVTNRCELMCLDTNGFHDDENDGEVKDEVDSTKADADIVWNLDMIGEYGVFPHNLATSSPVIHGDLVFILTSNGVAENHIDVPSPRSPCFMAINKHTGKLVWEKNQPFDEILHGQWSSPCVGVVDGKAQVVFPGGDGWVYAHDCESGEELWRCDLNPKDTVWKLHGLGTRNAIISTPVFHDNSVVISVGQDPEHGEGTGHMWRIDATKKGDVSAEVGEKGQPGKPNPNSGIVWHYGGDKDGVDEFRRTMSTVSITDGMVFCADLSGYVHCIDFESGKRHWEYDMLSGVWGSTLAVDGKVFLGNEDGDLLVFKASKDKAEVLAKITTVKASSIYSTPTFSDGVMYLSDRTRLYAVDVSENK